MYVVILYVRLHAGYSFIFSSSDCQIMPYIDSVLAAAAAAVPCTGLPHFLCLAAAPLVDRLAHFKTALADTCHAHGARWVEKFQLARSCRSVGRSVGQQPKEKKFGVVLRQNQIGSKGIKYRQRLTTTCTRTRKRLRQQGCPVATFSLMLLLLRCFAFFEAICLYNELKSSMEKNPNSFFSFLIPDQLASCSSLTLKITDVKIKLGEGPQIYLSSICGHAHQSPSAGMDGWMQRFAILKGFYVRLPTWLTFWTLHF